MLSALFAAEVEFVVVGAFALAAHGNARSTGDIDIYINPTPENANRVVEALKQFGAPMQQISAEVFSTVDMVFQIGVVPRRIDFLTSLEGIETFQEAWTSRMMVDVDGLQIPVLGKTVLIKNKKALGRPQDIADVAWLEASQK
ncbi:MAG: nucleotidyltransferase [Bacteroidetes bacterium]|nr:nucleotidyltransferase [Bacteroidota bacterium]